MKCERARRLAEEMIFADPQQASIGGDLGSVAQFEEHLWSCSDCRAQMKELRILRSQLRALGNRRAPAELVPRTMRALRREQWRRRALMRRGVLRLRRVAAAVAAVAVIAGVGAYLTGHQPRAATGGAAVTANVAPLVMEYADFRGVQPFGDRDGMTVMLAHMEESKQR